MSCARVNLPRFGLWLVLVTCRPIFAAAEQPPASARLLFTSGGKTALANADGTALRYLELDEGQATWQPGPCFSDGRRVILLSMEPRRDGPGQPFDEYYTQTPTHL